jgi:hypothetical protein
MKRSRIAGVLVLGLVACGVAAATYALAGSFVKPAVHRVAEGSKPVVDSMADAPNAQVFAVDFVELSREYAKTHGERRRIVRPHCVEASRGHYMCAYTVIRPNGRSECHLMQAMWTPGRASTITITLAGRTHKCGSVRQAVRSLS